MKGPRNKVEHGTLKRAFLEWQQDLRRPVLWVCLVGTGLVLAFAGAFGTAKFLRPVPLALYWVGLVCITYLAGSLVSALLRRPLKSAPRLVSALLRRPLKSAPRLLRVSCLGFATGAVLTLLIYAINHALFGPFLPTLSAFLQFAIPVFAVSVIISLVLDVVFAELAAEEQAPPKAQPLLLDRLPFEKRGRLVALSVEDHYVRVRTTKGEEMLLMRLGDAIKETTPEPGLQVHRSHWVALSAVTSARRDGSKGAVSLSHGGDVPVSRANLPALKEAGLLPG